MSEKYIPLYRKYRPKNLQEVVGQEHVKKALTNAICLNKATHAYLFTGPRGTGKTSIARILAKSLNCQQGPTITPCEVCSSCIDIKNSNPMDVIEIDAASNRKVEDTQNILEKIQYVPVNGKYKIYIIDEVHMLTKHAFNALLKTLEEPPENIIFILATTEPQKVLDTITSRCQRFDFRRITTDDIVSHLKNIAKLEKIQINQDALFTIAKNSAGGMRDALALLDQISVLDSSKNITSEDINKLLGRLSFDMLHELSVDIIQSDPQHAIELLNKIYNSGNEPTQILINLLEYFKNLLIVKNCTGDELLLDLTQLNKSQIQTLKSQSKNIDTHQITFLIEKIIYYIKELKTTTNQHLWLEIAIIDLANLAQNTSLLELQDRISKLENTLTNGGESIQSTTKPYIAKSIPIQNTNRVVIKSEENKQNENMKIAKSFSVPLREKNTVSDKIPKKINIEQEKSPSISTEKQVSNQKSDLDSLWIQLLHNILSTPTVSLLAQHTQPIEISEDKIIIGCKETFIKMLTNETKKIAIEEAAQKLFNKHVNIIINPLSTEEFQKVEKKNSISKHPTLNDIKTKKTKSTSPVKSEQRLEDEEYIEHKFAKTTKKREKFIPSDQVSMVIDLFDGKYID